MNIKKVYPDKLKLSRQSKLVSSAINELSDLGVEILSIKFRPFFPVIYVSNSNANKKIRSHFVGQGIDENGDNYLTRLSVFCGCNVTWREPRNG